MADPVDFDESNLVLVAPPGCEDSVIPLPVRPADGAIVFCWQLSEADLREIAATGAIWLSVGGGSTVPPVLVTGRKGEVL